MERLRAAAVVDAQRLVASEAEMASLRDQLAVRMVRSAPNITPPGHATGQSSASYESEGSLPRSVAERSCVSLLLMKGALPPRVESAQGPPAKVCASAEEAAAELLTARADAGRHCAASRALRQVLGALVDPAEMVADALSGLAAALPALELAREAEQRVSALRDALQAAVRASAATTASRGALEQRRRDVSVLVRRVQHAVGSEAASEEGARLAAALTARSEAERAFNTQLQATEALWAEVATAQLARAAEVATFAEVASGAASGEEESQPGDEAASAGRAADAAAEALMQAAAELLPARAATRTLIGQLDEAAHAEAAVLARLQESTPAQLAAALRAAARAAAAAASETPAEDAARSRQEASRQAAAQAALSGELSAKAAAVAAVAAAGPAAEARLKAEEAIDDMDHERMKRQKRRDWTPQHEAEYKFTRREQQEIMARADAAIAAATAAVQAQGEIHPELALLMADAAGAGAGGQQLGARFGSRASVRALPGDLGAVESAVRCVEVQALAYDERTGRWGDHAGGGDAAVERRERWFMKEFPAFAYKLFRNELRILDKARLGDRLRRSFPCSED